MTNPQPSSPPLRRQATPASGCAAAAAVLCALVAGCGEAKKELVFDEISRLPQREQLVELRLGRFSIPAPLPLGDAQRDTIDLHTVRLDFDLVAIVDPSDAKRVKALRKANQGRMRERVIQVCRGSTREELFEPEWTTLKAHLLDAVQPMLGGMAVKRLATPYIAKDLL
ncbi:MAG: hypothetical protein ACRCT8_03990 [Lacipirellulaceae bacterium]